jgi:AGCS family alanine or glycine:cation symporter
MAIPNLIGLLLLHKEIKTSIKDYWVDFKKNFPGVKTPV